MIKAYIIAKWSVYSLIIIPLLSSISIPIFVNNLGISPKYSYSIPIIIAISIALFLSKEKYSNIDIEILNSSKRFENGIGLIYFGHFLLAILYMVVTWQPVLDFFSLPVALLIFFSYVKGLAMTSEEIKDYKQNIQEYE